MVRRRVIPSLLLKSGGLVKSVKFNKTKYIGDPINAIKIFNDKEVDELAIIDITATKNKSINYDLLNRLNKEAFMPLAYGGGIRTLEDVQKVLKLGFEKVIIDSYALTNPEFITQVSNLCGSQSVVVCVDIKRNIFGNYFVYDYLKKKNTSKKPKEYCEYLQELGTGEIILYSVNNDGMMNGYDLNIIREVSKSLSIPIISLGGASKLDHFKDAINCGADAVSAGSRFVYHGPHKAVLISYLNNKEINELNEIKRKG